MTPNGRVISARDVRWDESHDVVVVGGGAGGLVSALHVARLGSRPVILERASEVGGSMKLSAAAYWVPNNTAMRQAGKTDDKGAFLRYVARLARPQAYDAEKPGLGLDPWEFESASALYDNAAVALDALVAMGAIKPLYSPHIPDYHPTLREAEVPYGRTLQIDRGDGKYGKGEVLTAQLVAALERLAVPVRCDHRAVGVIVDEASGVVGVRATHGELSRNIGAKQAVIFASGGFTHDSELRRNFLAPTILGGCAVRTNEGDFVHIATALGLPLRNMNAAWLAPMPFEIALTRSRHLSGIFAVPGDSMIWVDKYGRRVVNEKAVYNELACAFAAYDPVALEFSRLLLFMIWDERTARLFRPLAEHPPTTPPRLALDAYGNVIYDDVHLIRGATLDELSAEIEKRLTRLAPHTGGFRLDPTFRENLPASIARFNALAGSGRDADFKRGDDPVERFFNGPSRAENRTGNPTMHPIASTGPYYATIVCAGTIDTKGGPVTSPHGQVLDVDGKPVPGLYAVGNCAASATGQGYVAGGGTLGPIFTFAYLAAEHAARRRRRE